jgi:hypothetical protein
MERMSPAETEARWLDFQGYWQNRTGAAAKKIDWRLTWLNNAIDVRFDARFAHLRRRTAVAPGGPEFPPEPGLAHDFELLNHPVYGPANRAKQAEIEALLRADGDALVAELSRASVEARHGR